MAAFAEVARVRSRRHLLLGPLAAAVLACNQGGAAARSRSGANDHADAPSVLRPPLPAATEERVTLAEIPADSAGRRRFEVSVGPCDAAGACPLEVRLLEQSEPIHAIPLAELRAPREAVEVPVDPSWGAGDPLLGEPGLHAVRAGEEERAVAVLARGVVLSEARRGVLVTQQRGFEHVHRRNDLFVVREGRLERAWSLEEGAGPAWSTVAVVPRRQGGADALVVFSMFLHPDPDEPDTAQVSAVLWDDQRGAAVERAELSGVAPVHAAVIGGFESAATARRAASGEGCPGRLLVLPSASIPGAGASSFALVALSTRRRLAEAALDAMRRCAGADAARRGLLLELP